METGQRFGVWTVINSITKSRDGATICECRCDCGKEAWQVLSDLNRGASTRCRSCARRAVPITGPYICFNEHGTVLEALYSRYMKSKHRCQSPKVWNYKNYGGRGIKFLFSCAMDYVRYMYTLSNIEKLLEGWEIDRIDNDGNYEPGNLRVTTRTENANNTRKTVWIIRGDGKVYKGLAEATKEANTSAGNIVACCRGRRKTAGGFTWKYSAQDVRQYVR